MAIHDPYLPMEGVTRLYTRGLESLTSVDSSTTLPLYLQWSFPHYDFSAPLGRRQPDLRPVTNSMGLDESWHVLPVDPRESLEPIPFLLRASLLSSYVSEFVRFVSFDSPVNGFEFDPVLRDSVGESVVHAGGVTTALPVFPDGYRLLNVERLYRKPICGPGSHWGHRYCGCWIDPGGIEIEESGAGEGNVDVRVEVLCWGDIETISTLTRGMNVLGDG